MSSRSGGRRRIVPAVLVLPAVVVALLVSSGCSGGRAEAPQPGAKVTVLTARRVIPPGELGLSVQEANAAVSQQVPADLAGGDVLTDLADVKCLVAASAIPQGTILRKRMFVAPSDLGMEGGLTSAGSIVRSCS